MPPYASANLPFWLLPQMSVDSALSAFRISANDAGRCPGCEVIRQQTEDSIDRCRREWSRHSAMNVGINRLPRTNLYPNWSLGDATAGYAYVPTREHSCAMGDHVSVSRLLYHPLHITRADHEGAVNLVLFFHVVMPGEMVLRWGTAMYFEASFPLFGRLRRFWGPGLRIDGNVAFNGARRNRGARVQAELEGVRVRAVVRRPGVLRIESLSAEAVLQWGPRVDCYLPAITLQWQGTVPPAEELRAHIMEEPEACSLAELEEPLNPRTAFFISGGLQAATRAFPRLDTAASEEQRRRSAADEEEEDDDAMGELLFGESSSRQTPSSRGRRGV